MIPEIVLEPATADDVGIVENLIQSSYAQYRDHFSVTPDPLTLDYASLVELRETYLAKHEGEIVGCVSITMVNDLECILKNLAVPPSERGRGYGKGIVRAVERLAADNGASSITLWTRSEMVSNHRLYLTLGYAVIDSVNPAEGVYRLVFQKLIAQN